MNVSLFLHNLFWVATLVALTYVLPSQFIRFKILNQLRWIVHLISAPKASIAIVFIISFAFSAIISYNKKPYPSVPDEFSYLLAADTFSEGRLTNPTHPFWKHFESFHIIHQPSYASKYPPGQGLFLAVGQVITGRPIVGVWLSVAMACAAVCWMLHAWVPPKWALAGGLLSVLHPLSVYWGQNYWGGGVALLGGALLFGALRRLMKEPRTSTALVLIVGLFLLAISRPFEGLLTAISVAVLLAVWIVRQTQFSRIILIRSVFFPLGVGSLLIIGALAYYNYQITGSIYKLPYQVHEETYSPTPIFVWGAPNTTLKPYNPHLKKLHFGWSFDTYQRQQNSEEYWNAVSEKITGFMLQTITLPFQIPLPLGILLLMLPWIIKDRWSRIAVTIILLVSLINIFGATFFHIHYLAPIFPLIFFILIQGARHWRAARWRNRSQGPVFLAGFCLLFLALFFSKIWFQTSTFRRGLAQQRSELIEELKKLPQKDLVFVNYSDKHNPHFEWVYNRADIDNAEVVWAHILDKEENKKLLEYFSDRKVWWIYADSRKIKLNPLKNNENKTDN